MNIFFMPGFLWLQDDFGIRQHDAHLTMIFTVVIAVALIIQALAIVIAAAFTAKLLAKLMETVKRLEDRSGPIIEKVGVAVTDLIPKVHIISSNVEGMSYTVRAKIDEIGQTVTELNQTVQEINGRARVQVVRVDGIVTHAVATTAEISETVTQGIKVPIRQIAGVFAGVRAGLDTLIARSPFGRQ